MTDKTEKLFNAIGKLNDSYIDEAYADTAVQPKERRSVKRLVMIAFAAVLCLSLVVTVAANGDKLLNAIFERKKALIDDKIGHIDESVTVGEITLTMDTATVIDKSDIEGQFYGGYTVSFHLSEGAFDGGLKYGNYKLEAFVPADAYLDPDKVGDKEKRWYTISGDNFNAIEIFEGPLRRQDYGRRDPSNTITLESSMIFSYYADCRLTFYDLTSYDGSIKYADEISVEFTVKEEIAQPLQQYTNFYPGITFEIEGITFEVESLLVYPEHMRVEVFNKAGDTVNIAGIDCCALNYFTKLANSNEYFEKVSNGELDILQTSFPPTTEDENILNECYELVVEINPECGAEITSMITKFSGFIGEIPTPGEVRAGLSASFSSPIYVEDIVRVYARKIGDHSKEVTIWVPAEDKTLAEMKK